MKKILISLFLVVGLVSGYSADFRILTMDTNSARSYIPSSIIVTNGAVITSTNSVSSQAVIGVTNTAGAGDAGKVVKLNDSGLIATNFLSHTWGSFPFSTSFTSTNIAVTAATTYTNAHGLGGMPTLIQLRLINTSTDAGYSVNDELIIPSNALDLNNNIGVSAIPDASNIVVVYGSAAGSIGVLNKTTGATASIDDTKWKLIIKAWR